MSSDIGCAGWVVLGAGRKEQRTYPALGDGRLEVLLDLLGRLRLPHLGLLAARKFSVGRALLWCLRLHLALALLIAKKAWRGPGSGHGSKGANEPWLKK